MFWPILGPAWVPGCTLWGRGLMGHGLEAYDLPPSSDEIKKKWISAIIFRFPLCHLHSTEWKVDYKEIFKEVFESNLEHNVNVCVDVLSNSAGQSVWGPGFEPENSRIPKRKAPPSTMNSFVLSLNCDLLVLIFVICSSAACIRIWVVGVFLITGKDDSCVVGRDVSLSERVVPNVAKVPDSFEFRVNCSKK